MENNHTELVFILDRSGSMAGLESDTIGGYNAMLDKQKQVPGEALVTTVLFDDQYELLHDRANIAGIAPITQKEYYVRGTTALLDAIGRTLQKIDNAQKNVLPNHKASKVIVVITTDGMENASREYAGDKIKAMVERQQEECGWEFIFLGANIDAIATAKAFGIHQDRAANFMADSHGVQLNYRAVGEAVAQLRTNALLSADWKDGVEDDYRMRRAPEKKG